MRGAETSKTMLPCMRGVHLHKSASFKMILEQPQTHHKTDTTPKIPFNTYSKHDAENLDTYYQQYAKLSGCCFPFWSQILETFPG